MNRRAFLSLALGLCAAPAEAARAAVSSEVAAPVGLMAHAEVMANNFDVGQALTYEALQQIMYAAAHYSGRYQPAERINEIIYGKALR
jgi:hypothetical protein